MVEVRIAKENVPEEDGYYVAFSELFQAKAGDEGFYFVNGDFGRHSGFLTYFTERDDFEMMPETNLLNFFGVKRDGQCQIAVVTGMPYVYRVRIRKKKNVYSIALVYDAENYTMTEDPAIEIYDLPADSDWFAMAKYYRQLILKEGKLKRLKEQAATREMPRYLLEAPEIRIRMGWKPAPPEVLEQTIENEPEMHAACTFDTVKKLIAELKKQGVGKAQLCLVGWNKSGHDGRWPTAFPVEEKFGGEEKLLELVKYAKENGYRITGHTNALDCYSISEKWNGGEITIKTKDGQPKKNDRGWSGGMMYWLCPVRALELARETYDEMDRLGFDGAMYSDVMSIVKPRQCFDPVHPVTSRECVHYWDEIRALSQRHFGGFESEGVFEHALKDLDYGLYQRFNRERLTGMDEGVPSWEAVYHDFILANPATNTINYNCGEPENRLQLLEMCGRPCFYYYTAFMKVTSWGSMKSRETFVLNSDEDIVKTAALIKEGYDEYQSYNRLLTEEVTGFRKLSGDDVTETTYESGSRVIVNYLPEDFTCEDGTVVKAKDYVIL